jgi:trimeric autotransporter adhesin
MEFYFKNCTLFSFFPLALLSSALFEEASLLSRGDSVRKKSSEISKSVQNEPASIEESKCALGSHSMQIGVRHCEGDGIGYQHGYTTLQTFLSLPHCIGSFTPFLDLRGHVFNNGKFAANTGMGLRYLTRSIAWGVNSYYDYRNTYEFHYNQWGAGLEAIGSFWSINVNGYLPIGKKKSAFYDPSIIETPTTPSFAFFEGNQMFINLSGTEGLAAKREFAFKGLDTKFTVRAFQKGIMAVDMGIGPYYFQGYYKKYAVGGEANIQLRFSDYMTISGSSSYDNLFHLRMQGSVGVSIPFGPRNFDKNCKKKQPCQNAEFFNYRLTRGSNRSEIIVVDHHQKILANAVNGPIEVAINPATSQPYTFWFVNNLSHSDGTYESPFPTIQEALSVAQANDAIYVYPGDNSPYDVNNLTLLQGQYFLGSGFDQNVSTTVGTITIPSQTPTSPKIENSIDSTIVTVANQNMVSGFNFLVLNAGNTVVANSINSLSFLNNTFTTSLTSGINNLSFTDCFGTLLVENNQFIMDPADTGSSGVTLSDAGSNPSTLSLLNNTFSNHANTAVTLNYSGSSTVILDFDHNSFTPALGVAGTNGIDLVTSNAVVLADSIFTRNTLSGYTNQAINCNWAGTGGHNLTLSNNSISTDPSALGTIGYNLTTTASGASYLTANNNQFLNQTNNNLQCITSANASLQLALSGNTITGLATPGNNGIRITSAGSSTINGTIMGNVCSEHLGANINGSPNSSSNLSLTIANNTLSAPSSVPVGSFPYGIQFDASNASTLSFNINHNTLNNHTRDGINLSVTDTAAVALATIDSNTLSVPDNIVGTSGIAISGSNSAPIISTFIVTNNSCTGHTSQNINCFPTASSIIDLTIAGNSLNGPTVTPMGSFPNAIQIGTLNASQVAVTINNQNIITNHTDKGINLFASDTSSISAIIDGNTITAPITTASTTAINVGGNNSSALPASSFTISNNSCTGHTNGTIQCFANQNHHCDLVITGNTITSALAGVSGASPTGILVSASDNSAITNPTISNNSWTSSKTYDPSGTPQGLSFGISNNATFTNALINNNTFNIAVTNYQAGTEPSGIQTYSNDSSTLTGLSITNNKVNFLSSNYATNTGPTGISTNAAGTSSLTNLLISANIITFAPLLVSFANFQESGISVNASDTATLGTSLVPAMISQNSINQIEGNGITLLTNSNNDVYMTAFNNSVSLGNVEQNEIGIITLPFGNGKLVAVIDSNTIKGNHGGFVGIFATNQSTVCQSVTIKNNSVTNVLGVNPSVPISGIGGGLGAAILSLGDLNVIFDNNGVSGNTPQGIFGLDSAAFGASGTLCVQLQNNKGVGALPPDNYVLYNPTMAPPTTFHYYNAGGNLGTLLFNPSSADFTNNGGPCPTCP